MKNELANKLNLNLEGDILVDPKVKTYDSKRNIAKVTISKSGNESFLVVQLWDSNKGWFYSKREKFSSVEDAARYIKEGK